MPCSSVLLAGCEPSDDHAGNGPTESPPPATEERSGQAPETPGAETSPSLVAPPPPAEPQPGTADPAIGLTDRQRERLRELGLEDPERDILAHLAERPQLIPEEGVLGGTMYWVPAESAVLTDRWVLATYEDGHVRGRALLEYEVEAADSIRWRVIESRIDS